MVPSSKDSVTVTFDDSFTVYYMMIHDACICNLYVIYVMRSHFHGRLHKIVVRDKTWIICAKLKGGDGKSWCV